MAHDGLAHQLGPDELADSATRRRRVIGDHRKITLVLAHDLVDDPLGLPTPMNPPIIRLAPSGIMATD